MLDTFGLQQRTLFMLESLLLQNAEQSAEYMKRANLCKSIIASLMQALTMDEVNMELVERGLRVIVLMSKVHELDASSQGEVNALILAIRRVVPQVLLTLSTEERSVLGMHNTKQLDN